MQMRSVSILVLAALVAPGHAKELDSWGQLVHTCAQRLFDRVLKPQAFQHVDMDNATLGKSSQLQKVSLTSLKSMLPSADGRLRTPPGAGKRWALSRASLRPLSLPAD